MAREIPDDVQIHRDVLAQLQWAVGQRTDHLAITVKDGEVAITGWLTSPAKRSEAAQAVRCVRGVRRVVNEIVVPVMTPLSSEP
jgi:osmotically-inducible protein OsmY